jgi:uncharacterized protein (TIGR02265 family)
MVGYDDEVASEPVSGSEGAVTMDDCFQYSDLKWRLDNVPDSAACRGVYLNALDRMAGEFGPPVSGAYRDYFNLYTFSAIKLYPVKDYLTRLVKLAQINYGGPNIYKGIFEIQARMPLAWTKTLLGRAFMGIIGRDYRAALSMLKASINKSINYGTFDLIDAGPDSYLAQFRSEYVYIEHAMAGGLVGLARACGVEVKLDIRLKDPFNGDIGIQIVRDRQ